MIYFSQMAFHDATGQFSTRTNISISIYINFPRIITTGTLAGISTAAYFRHFFIPDIDSQIKDQDTFRVFRGSKKARLLINTVYK
jgi:hypothetical protein